ncbi:hypothetical protein F444_09090 [Phytophthora nicotianae P1976]|uniref:PH domain-containing protein n=1 Tax=Phytophthora nicotianae P1976 TaxID=1317066 RepID=A0A081A8T0_PHYNI|nr:hypothetical protein F444_09090 [Phytophthora nicotianae P1976]
MSSTAESLGFRLKRKVRNAETNLFEWTPCSCTIVARDGKLLLELQSPPRGEESQDESDSDTEIITIDLATQLLNVVPKKNKARCDLEYYPPVATMSGDVLKEELMAPSAAQCQQWMVQVRRVQQQAHQQRRPTSSSSTRSGASPVAPLPSPLTSVAELTASRESRMSTNDAATPSSMQSNIIRDHSPLRRRGSCEMSSSELAQPEVETIHENMASEISDTLPERPAVVCRVRERCDDRPAVNNSDLDYTVDSSGGSPPLVFEPAHSASISSISSVSTAIPPTSEWRRGSGTRISSPEYSSSESDTPHSPHRSRRCRSTHNVRDFSENNNFGSDDDHEPTQYRRRGIRRSAASDERHKGGVKLTTSSLSSPFRVSARTLQSSRRSRDPPVYEEGASSQAELHILQRVEAALRALELENAQAKARERELLQEIQTLRDGARVAAAERKHTEHEYRHARRKAESWKRAAQSAEAAAAQLQEQLGIAHEENQLLAAERLRLKRQNNELLTQVHRLDSLVYGRF